MLNKYVKVISLLLATGVFLNGCSSLTYSTNHGDITIKAEKPTCVIVNSSDRCIAKKKVTD